MGFIIVLVVGLLLLGIVLKVKESNVKTNRAEQRRLYAESLGEHIRVVVNDGTLFFYVDDLNKTYGIDESGNRYALNDVVAISINKNRISIQQKKGYVFIEIGDVNSIVAQKSIGAIVEEFMKVIRNNLEREFSIHRITPTKEYVHNGSIWGYDIESQKFYTTQYGISIYDFADLLSVKIDNGMEGKYKIAEKRIHVNVKSENDDLKCFEYDLYFDVVNDTYHNLLSMFKGIRNRANIPRTKESGDKSFGGDQSATKTIDPASYIHTIYDIVKRADEKEETNLEGVVELFVCALIKYVVDKTSMLRREKMKVFDGCMSALDHSSVINGEVIYSNNPPEEAREVIGSLDNIATGFPQLICNCADNKDVELFVSSAIALIQCIELYVVANSKEASSKNASLQYINEVKDMMNESKK